MAREVLVISIAGVELTSGVMDLWSDDLPGFKIKSATSAAWDTIPEMISKQLGGDYVVMPAAYGEDKKHDKTLWACIPKELVREDAKS